MAVAAFCDGYDMPAVVLFLIGFLLLVGWAIAETADIVSQFDDRGPETTYGPDAWR